MWGVCYRSIHCQGGNWTFTFYSFSRHFYSKQRIRVGIMKWTWIWVECGLSWIALNKLKNLVSAWPSSVLDSHQKFTKAHSSNTPLTCRIVLKKDFNPWSDLRWVLLGDRIWNNGVLWTGTSWPKFSQCRPCAFISKRFSVTDRKMVFQQSPERHVLAREESGIFMIIFLVWSGTTRAFENTGYYWGIWTWSQLPVGLLNGVTGMFFIHQVVIFQTLFQSFKDQESTKYVLNHTVTNPRSYVTVCETNEWLTISTLLFLPCPCETSFLLIAN